MKIKYLGRINGRSLPENTDPNFEFHYVDISAANSTGKLNLPANAIGFGQAPSRARRIAPAGSTVISTVRTYLRAIAFVPESAVPLIFSTGFAVIEPLDFIDARFFSYACQSDSVVQEIAARSTGVSYPAINPSEIGNIDIVVPCLEEQRRIAEFLDAEMARIDDALSVRQAAKGVLGERFSVLIDEVCEKLSTAHGTMPFRRLISGIEQGHSPQCENIPAEPDRWGVLKVSAVKDGMFFPAENKMLPSNLAPERRYEIADGDLLVTRANTPNLVGSVAVVHDPPAKLLLCDKIFRIAVHEQVVPEFIALISRGSRIRSLCAQMSHGTSPSMANLKSQDIKEWPIPIAPEDVQRETVARFRAESQLMEKLRDLIDTQIKVLTERRQALITAAVTGRLDVTTGREAELS
ncbi:restriction endonuclease subunit S [Actinoplanes sp. NEAU-A12]|uniref:Restriction endonuclease subunit S n=1 Tax=Actinoplanes sandaracinus TaxID=3045177 RepID=A0ABT6WC19_9ACTN|nr:restriction endonuclease subunit S [Actinoplanes sandaracinus]MDI6097254.1 restriction endonuclease subunit S [Actinoplanes sandaracinus]